MTERAVADGQAARRGWLHHRSPRSIPLWGGIVVPPLAWATQLVLGDFLFELGCAPGVEGPRLWLFSLEGWALLVSAAAAAVTVLAGLLSFRAWRRLRRERDGTTWHRAETMAVMGMASAFLYLMIIVYGFFPMFVLPTCAPVL